MSRALLDDVVLKLIDASLLLHANVTTRDIYRHLGLSRQKISRVFQDYLELNPESMIYVPAKKKYLATKTFKPYFFNEDTAREFVDSLIIVFGTFES